MIVCDDCCDDVIFKGHSDIYNHYNDYSSVRIPPHMVGPCGVDINENYYYIF